LTGPAGRVIAIIARRLALTRRPAADAGPIDLDQLVGEMRDLVGEVLTHRSTRLRLDAAAGRRPAALSAARAKSRRPTPRPFDGLVAKRVRDRDHLR
jgi:hypothetical protein